MINSEEIINLRQKKRWTQQELAHFLDVSQNTISQWESGSRKPTGDAAIKLLKIIEGITSEINNEMQGHDMYVKISRLEKENATLKGEIRGKDQYYFYLVDKVGKVLSDLESAIKHGEG